MHTEKLPMRIQICRKVIHVKYQNITSRFKSVGNIKTFCNFFVRKFIY